MNCRSSKIILALLFCSAVSNIGAMEWPTTSKLNTKEEAQQNDERRNRKLAELRELRKMKEQYEHQLREVEGALKDDNKAQIMLRKFDHSPTIQALRHQIRQEKAALQSRLVKINAHIKHLEKETLASGSIQGEPTPSAPKQKRG